MQKVSEVLEAQRRAANGNKNAKAWGNFIFNVDVYGAKGDGVADDTAEVQAAIDDAIKNGSKVVFFPPGTYNVTALTNVDSVVLVGDNAVFSGISNIITQFGAKAPLSQTYNYNINNTLKKLYRGEAVTIVAAGDSLTQGSGASRTELDWETSVGLAVLAKFPQSGVSWLNTGVGGTNSTYLKDNWNTLVKAFNPNLIIISHGTNDTGLTESQRHANYKFFVDQAAILGAELLFVTNSTVRFTPAPYGNTPDTEIALRDSIAEQTRKFAREFGVGLCDANLSWRRWLSERNLTTSSTLLHYDHIHPNDLGHRLIAYEVMNAFDATTDNVRELDRRYGGKGYDLYGSVTFRDLAHKLANVNGWGSFDMQHQLVDWGGMWSIEDYYGLPFVSAKLWGTRAVTGSEPYENLYVDDMHIIPVDKDYIELEVKDAKKVWFTMDGSSATTTAFKVMVDGVKTLDFTVSTASAQPIEVPFYLGGTNYFPKGTHKVRIERVGNLPASQYAAFRGFLVSYYADNEGEYFSTPNLTDKQSAAAPTYTTFDTTIDGRTKASQIGLVAPFGYNPSDTGFVQLAVNRPAVAYIDFYGDTATVVLKGVPGNNYVSIYIDSVLKETVNASDASFANLTYQYSSLGTKKHRLEIVAPKAQVNIVRVRFSDTLV